ncbi:MAG: cytochrome [Bacteroidetes bacterium]|nr:cytochrome [Bacteroidota bacterium]
MRKQIISIALVAAALTVLSSCGFDAKKPGRVYMPDMTYSNALEAYAPSTILNEDGDSVSTRKPVAGTIPRGWIPTDEKIRTNEAFLMSYMAKNYFTHTAEKWQEEYDKAGASLKDPLEYTAENKAAGAKLYNTHCINCHGASGNGQGNLVVLEDGKDGPFTAVPPDYKKRLPEIKDGNIFYSVSYGKGMMGGYGYSLNVTERWQVIHYIKGLAGVEGAATGAAAKEGDKKDDKAAAPKADAKKDTKKS